MDPHETLRKIRIDARIINTLTQIEDITDAQRNEMLDRAESLAENVANLDAWMAKGGASPWERTLADAIPFWDDWLPSTLRERER